MNYDVKVELNYPKIIDKVTNDEFGIKLATEWKKLIDPYTPRKSGSLESSVNIRPFEIEYTSVYAHYQYMGEVYEDPLYHVAGWIVGGTAPNEIWRSRKGIKKVKRTVSIGNRYQYLVYSREFNPEAIDHWDLQAKEAGQMNKLYQVMNDYLRNKVR